MKTIRLLAAALLLVAGAVPAQTAPGAASGPAASAPRTGPGHMGGRWGRDYTPGWSLMSPAERQEHQARMRSMANHQDCQAFMQRHHDEMAARAKAQGRTLPPRPRRDGCAGLPP